MSSELEHHLSDLSAEADSVLDEAHRLLLDFHPANTSNNYSATDESENQPNSMGAAMVSGNHSNSNVDEDSDIEEIVQEIPVVSLLDSTIDVGPLPDAQSEYFGLFCNFYGNFNFFLCFQLSMPTTPKTTT